MVTWYFTTPYMFDSENPSACLVIVARMAKQGRGGKRAFIWRLEYFSRVSIEIPEPHRTLSNN